MDAKGLGRKLLLTLSGDPRRTPEKQTVGTVTASQKMLSRALSIPVLQRGAAWAEERLLGALRQPVPQNGRVHLHIIETRLPVIILTRTVKIKGFYRKYGIRTPKIWHTNPPPFMPYELFLLGVGVVFHM